MKNKIALCWTSTTIKYDFPLRDITLWGARRRAPIIFTYFVNCRHFGRQFKSRAAFNELISCTFS